MKEIAEKTINELVDETPALIEYFENRGIDYCCGGDVSLQKTIALKELDEQLIVREIEAVLNTPTKSNTVQSIIDSSYLSVSSLIQYVTDKHHTATRKMLDELGVLTEKIAHVHGAHHPELIALSKLFKTFKGELIKHLQKEELFVFPGLIEMENRLTKGAKRLPRRAVDELWQPIGEEHVETGEVLEQFKELTNNFKLPEDACNSYTRTYQLLDALVRDIHVHVHIEEHILMPKAQKIYEQLID